MFDILFGWRKASKCKKLIRQIQCRLKLLKNKRCSIVRQLRDDVAQLLKHGHEHSAFDRAEQLFKDESIIAVYDLLDQFCEFIIINLPYIRKHKDCPNDINEAVSTLIFASARCGDLPELILIRKLFGERYGQRFAMVALELLPGNLVNRQIKDNLSIKSVPNDVKYRLVDEIARSCLQPGPLALEYYSELHKEQSLKNMGDRFMKNDVQTKYSRNEESPVQAFNTVEAEANVVYVDLSTDGKFFLIEPLHPQKSPDSTGGSIQSANSVEFPMQRKEEEGSLKNSTQLNSPREFRIPGRHNTTESSSESSSQLPKEMIYLDDIAEFRSPMNKKGQNSLDQRLFMFKSSVIDLPTDELEYGLTERNIKKNESRKQKSGLRRRRRSRESSGIRQRTSVNDVESAIYYGEWTPKSHHQRKHQKKIQPNESLKSNCERRNSGSKGRIVHECSLENPCYFFTGDDADDWEGRKKRVTNLEGKETKASYTRAMTMLPGRLSDCCVAEKILRANSFPVAQQPSHVHPKLPDYDQIAAKFMALKKANPNCKSRLS